MKRYRYRRYGGPKWLTDEDGDEAQDNTIYVAEAELAAAVERERREIIYYLDGCYQQHHDEDLRRAIVTLRAGGEGKPGKA